MFAQARILRCRPTANATFATGSTSNIYRARQLGIVRRFVHCVPLLEQVQRLAVLSIEVDRLHPPNLIEHAGGPGSRHTRRQGGYARRLAIVGRCCQPRSMKTFGSHFTVPLQSQRRCTRRWEVVLSASTILVEIPAWYGRVPNLKKNNF